MQHSKDGVKTGRIWFLWLVLALRGPPRPGIRVYHISSAIGTGARGSGVSGPPCLFARPVYKGTPHCLGACAFSQEGLVCA